jgi:hypothetical protein
VIDAQTETLYSKEIGIRANYDSGKVYIEQRSIVDRRMRTLVLDLAKGKYDVSLHPNFLSGPGVLSPDHRRRVAYEQGLSRFLILERESTEHWNYSTKWGFGEFDVTCNGCSLSNGPPVVWIDNDRFITQRSNGMLVIYDFRTKDWTDLVTIPLRKIIDAKPVLQKDAQGNFFYEVDHRLYKLDVENKRYSEVPLLALPFGFRRTGGDVSKLFVFNNKPLGEFITRGWAVADGYLAIDYRDKPLGEVAGIKVWSATLGTWTSIEFHYSPLILGWIDEL